MASNNIDDEKPNLRPTKHNAARGKSVFLHHNPNQPLTKAYIHATNTNIGDENLPDNQQSHIAYSLNKHQRWKLLNECRQQHTRTDSSSDSDRYTQSDSEQKPNKNKLLKRFINHKYTKYRLYKVRPLTEQICSEDIGDDTHQGQKQKPEKAAERSQRKNDTNYNENEVTENSNDLTYFAVVPPPNDNGYVNIRKDYNTKSKKTKTSIQRNKLIQPKEQMSEEEEEFEDEEDSSLTDDDESLLLYYTYTMPDQMQLNDFIPNRPTGDPNRASSNSNQLTTTDSKASRISSEEDHSLKGKHRYYRQISKEEILFNRDMASFVKMQQENGEAVTPKTKSHHHLMQLSFRKVYLRQSDYTIENLSAKFGKNFLHAQCYPTKYLICLTDHLKSFEWSNKFQFFSLYTALNCYLIINLSDEINDQENVCQGYVGLNMDLALDKTTIKTLSESERTVYSIDALIDETLDFITNLSFDKFKPIDIQSSQKKYFRNEKENELSESEFVNEQIKQINLLDKKDLSEQLNDDLSLTNNDSITQPEVCIICCSDMNKSTPMTALKACRHWLCNECWKQYLESSVKSNNVIRCPEWNCCSLVDFGTILSLVNIRCMRIYERNLERCLVNLSRSFIKCPSKSCGVICQIINSGLDYVRCRCGHQFCINCKHEPHFPANCNAYRAYMNELIKNGDTVFHHDATCTVTGRHCVSCHNFIEKNGGCNHMTCRCGAEFCWLCTAYWKDHSKPNGEFSCPRKQISLEKQIFKKERNTSRRFYENSVFHRYQRAYQNQMKQNEHVKRLVGTIPLNKENTFDKAIIKSEIDKREAILKHAYEMVKYVSYLHRVCEFIAVAADGYGSHPPEFSNSLLPLETLTFNMSQVFEGGRGYQAIEQLNDLHKKSEYLLERLRQAIRVRQLQQANQNGYMTS